LHTFDEVADDLPPVDVLVIGRGVDSADPGPLAERLDATRYRFNALLYA
jgi:hypothetical protein